MLLLCFLFAFMILLYASTNDSILWTNVQCFNFSASGTYASDNTNKGATSQFGTNLTQLETYFNINSNDVDGVNETFLWNETLDAHDTFYTNNLEFQSGECASTFIYDNTGSGTNDHFEEVLLYDPDTRSIIFTSLLEENVLGFDGRSHDFQMLVLEEEDIIYKRTTIFLSIDSIESQHVDNSKNSKKNISILRKILLLTPYFFLIQKRKDSCTILLATANDLHQK